MYGVVLTKYVVFAQQLNEEADCERWQKATLIKDYAASAKITQRRAYDGVGDCKRCPPIPDDIYGFTINV